MGSRAQAQSLWRTGLVAPRHMGSSRTRARIRVPCIGRRILNHCATREVPDYMHFNKALLNILYVPSTLVHGMCQNVCNRYAKRCFQYSAVKRETWEHRRALGPAQGVRGGGQGRDHN